MGCSVHLQPIGILKPLLIQLLVIAVFFDFGKKAVQPFNEFRIALAYAPSQRFVGKRLIQKHQFAFAALTNSHCVIRRVVNKSVGFAVDRFHTPSCSVSKRNC